MKNVPPKPSNLKETGEILAEQAKNLEDKFFNPKNSTVVKETRMPEGVVLLAGVVFFIIAMVILMKVRDNDAAKANETYQSVLGAINTLSERFEMYKTNQADVCRSFEDDIEKLQKKTAAPQEMNLNLILDVAVTLALEVGRVNMSVRELL